MWMTIVLEECNLNLKCMICLTCWLLSLNTPTWIGQKIISTIDESDAFLKINLDDDYAPVIIEDSKKPIDSSDDHEVDIEYKNLTPYSPQRSSKKRWDDAMKTDLETLMNENTHLPTLIKQVFAAEQVVFDKITLKTTRATTYWEGGGCSTFRRANPSSFSGKGNSTLLGKHYNWWTTLLPSCCSQFWPASSKPHAKSPLNSSVQSPCTQCKPQLWSVISYLIKKRHSGSNAFGSPVNNDLQRSWEINQIVNDSHQAVSNAVQEAWVYLPTIKSIQVTQQFYCSKVGQHWAWESGNPSVWLGDDWQCSRNLV